MEKLDLKKTMREYFSASKNFSLYTVPECKYLSVHGEGDPNTSKEYSQALAALYGSAYTLKFANKSFGQDFVVPPLEGLWWADDMKDFKRRNKSKWKWTMLIMVPDFITTVALSSALHSLGIKKPDLDLSGVELTTIAEGLSVQILHVGPYDDEAPTLKALHDSFMPTNHFGFNGKHHEIYLGDPRKSDPARLKTILRQPVALIK